MLRIAEAWGATYPGRKPGPNQDSILVGNTALSQGQVSWDDGLPFQAAVADGISGDPGGEVASSLAVQALCGARPHTFAEAVETLQTANGLITMVAKQNPDVSTMCTTIAAAWIYEDGILWCTRGDTPIYIATDYGLTQISRPHADKRGYITSYLGASSPVTIRSTDGMFMSEHLNIMRAVIIMSDGISNFVTAYSLLDLVHDTTSSVQELGIGLMRRAFQNGSHDNMSFIMARIEDTDEDGD